METFWHDIIVIKNEADCGYRLMRCLQFKALPGTIITEEMKLVDGGYKDKQDAVAAALIERDKDVALMKQQANKNGG